jgi:hypothetical protein
MTSERDANEPTKIQLDPVEAIKAILRVDPDSEPVEDESEKPEPG